MRIALFSDTYQPSANGIASVLIQLRRELTARGHRVFLIVPAVPSPRPPQETGDPDILRIPSLPLPLPTGDRGILPRAAPVLRFLQARSPQIIHLHTEFTAARLAARCARNLGIPLVYTAHTRWEEYRHYLPGGRLLPRGAAVQLSTAAFRSSCRGAVAPSPLIRPRLSRLFPTLPLRVIPNGIDREGFLQGLSRQGLSCQELSCQELSCQSPKQWLQPVVTTPPAQSRPKASPFRVLYVGRMNREKQVTELSRRLIPFLRKETPGRRREAVCLGRGRQLSAVRKIFQEAGASGQLSAPGSVPWEEIPRHYASASVFVSLSRSEVHPMTALEALTAGLPLIAPAGAGFDGMVQPGRNGWLLTHPRELPGRLEELAALPAAARRAMGEKSREISRRLDVSIQAEKYLEFYREILARE